MFIPLVLVDAGSVNARAMKVEARDGSSCCSFRASLKGNRGFGVFVFWSGVVGGGFLESTT